MGSNKKFHAFISYSHKDKAYAASIQKSIEKLGIPFYRSWQTDVNIFRDERKIPLAGSLTEQIIAGLKESEHLIVIASKNSANSTWVREEILNWYQLNQDENGYITNFNFILTDDVIEWDYQNHDFDKLKTTALPSFERRMFKELPLWANLQLYCKAGKVQTKNSNYEWEIAKIKGLLLGKRPDEVIDEVSKGKRLFRITGGVVISILIALSGLAFYLRDEAVKQLENAVKQEKIARSNYLVSEARNELAANPSTSVRLVEEAAMLQNGSNNSYINEVANKIYQENNFYKIIGDKFSEITAIAFSPDGEMILSGYDNGTACLWDLKGKLIQKFKNHTDRITCLTFSIDGKTVLTGSFDKTVCLSDLTGKLLKKFKSNENLVKAVDFSPNGKYILVGFLNGQIQLWDSKGNLLKRFNNPSSPPINDLAFSPDGKFILTGSWENAKLWDLKGKLLQKFENRDGSASSVAFSPDGESILIGSDYKTAILFDLKGKIVQQFRAKSEVVYVAFSPNGESILTGGYHTARLWGLDGEIRQEFKGHTGNISSVAFSPDGKKIITCAGDNGLTGFKDRSIRLWGVNECLRNFMGHADLVSSVAFSPNKKNILTGAYDKTARLWDLKGKFIKEFIGHTGKINTVAFSPDGKTILTGSGDSTARLWDLHGNLIRIFNGHHSDINSVSFSPDGKTILTGSDDATAILWGLNGTILHIFKNHTITLNHRQQVDGNLIITKTGINSVAFSPDGKTILTGADDRKAILCDLKGTILQEFEVGNRVNSVAFAPDGKTILLGSEKGIVGLWNLRGKNLKKIKIEGYDVISVAFSPSGKSILAGCTDGSVRQWDLNGNLFQELKDNFNIISSVGFSSDGKLIIIGNFVTARLWNAKMPLKDFLKSGEIEPLTSAQKKRFNIK